MKSKFYLYLGLLLLFVVKKLIWVSSQLKIAEVHLRYLQRICAIRHIARAKIHPNKKLLLLQSLDKPVSSTP